MQHNYRTFSLILETLYVTNDRRAVFKTVIDWRKKKVTTVSAARKTLQP